MTTFEQYNLYPTLTPVRVVATANQAGTYNNGPSNNGVGATFTYATGALTIDAVTIAVGDRVLFQNQTSAFQNGIYVCNVAGAVGVAAVLQRAADQQSIEQLHVGQTVAVAAGTADAGGVYTLVEPLPAQLGVSNMSWTSATGVAGLGTASTKAASDNTKATVSSVATPTIVNHMAIFTDTNGTLGEDQANAINGGGNVQAGISGTAGTLISFPATAANGSLILAAANNAGGNFNTTISNAGTVAQSQVISIPDSGATTANFILSKTTGTQHITVGSLAVDAGTLTSGISTGGQIGTLTLFSTTAANGALILAAVNAGANFNTTISNGVMGQSTVYTIPDIGAATGNIVVSTSALRMKSVAGAAAAGGAAAQSFTDTFCTTGSNVVGNWNTQANAASVLKIVPGNGSFVVTSSADAGVGTFNYIITK